ncbi:lipid A-modifier LpxR family protein [Balneola sp. EhC07]|uniref:lipid A-modifier LpxR family protein n=1 Tax=Balneola sp. EhC07 TaxID=1849360 RepID=UPI0009EEC062|nr:lipid A-modifier LpxR family protein [Balneola sp. EhC07]
MKAIILFICFAITAVTVKAQTCTDQYRLLSDWSFTMDNDTFTHFIGLGFLNEDRNYTQGGEIALNSPRLGCSIRNLIERWNWHTKIHNHRSSLSFQEPTKIFLRYSAFTPDDLRKMNPVIGDRPYSSVVWLGLNFNWLDQKLYTKQSWEFNIGAIGIPKIAESIQTAIHKPQNEHNTKPPYNPEGWDNQISHGGELTVLLSYSRKKLITKNAIETEALNNDLNKGKFKSQLVRTIHLDVGHILQGGFGLEFRLGKLDLRNWHFNPSRNTDAITVAPGSFGKKIKYFNRKRIREIYFYGDLRASVLLYNGSLHGQFRSSNYTLPWRETGFVYGSSRIGFMLKGKDFLFSPYVAMKSPEFWNKNSRVHTWAGFTINRTFCLSKE